MPTESEVIDQLSDYCHWLEAELAAPMHRTRVVETMRHSSAPSSGASEIIALSTGPESSRTRSRLVLSIAAAMLLMAGAVTLATRGRDHEKTTTVPAVSVDTDPATTEAQPETGRTFSDNWAPVNLPAGLVVWDVGWGRNGGTYGAPFTEQLFGQYDATNTTVDTALLIRVQDSVDEVLPADTNTRVTVRGAQGWVFNPDPSSASVSIEWVELGRQVSVQGHGMTLDETVTALDELLWRADGSPGFEPASSPLPLIDEASSGTEFGGDETTFSITDPDGPTPISGPLGSQDTPTAISDVVVVQIGASIPGALAPDLIFNGRRRADGAVVSDGVMVEPGGRIIRVLGGDTLASPEAILAAVSPISGSGMRALVEEANSRQLQLPEVASSEFAGGTVVLRGGTRDWPLAICLEVDAGERCRSVAGLHQFASWQNSVLIDGRWFIVGRQPSTDASPVVYPWTPGLSAQFPRETIFEPTQSQGVRDQLLWFVEIPRGTDVVGVGYLSGDTVTASTPTGAPLTSALRRPDQ